LRRYYLGWKPKTLDKSPAADHNTLHSHFRENDRIIAYLSQILSQLEIAPPPTFVQAVTRRAADPNTRHRQYSCPSTLQKPPKNLFDLPKSCIFWQISFIYRLQNNKFVIIEQ
jgi:hypothetical protein